MGKPTGGIVLGRIVILISQVKVGSFFGQHR